LALTQEREQIPWKPMVNQLPTKALDIHYFSRVIRDLIFCDPISEFLGLLFDSKAIASQSLGFLRGSAQEAHQDSAYVAYTLPRQFAASWIALEDVTVGGGELFYYPGSQYYEDFNYQQTFKSMHEARRVSKSRVPESDELSHLQSLNNLAKEHGIEKTAFVAKKGDILIWHADLVHGGNPISNKITRKSVVTHYCPKYAYPLYAEERVTKLHDHNGHGYTSGYYLDKTPLG
jgi:ectoine hydroxylase-related dioxygenase (phytanoyl-CoA dioxygenase family)